MNIGVSVGLFFLLAGDSSQEATEEALPSSRPAGGLTRTVDWKEGHAIPLRVPVAQADRELMTAVAFPEERIEAAVTGWPEGAITATARGGRLFIRLPRKGEGHLNVIGGSGRHYLLHLEGIEKPEAGSYDSHVTIRREEANPPAASRARARPRPVGALALIESMRLGLRPEGARILRARGEVAWRSDRVEVRLLFVYVSGPYVGRIYDVENLAGSRQPLDVSRFRAKEELLIASALRENVLDPAKTTRLYTVFWRSEGP